MGLLLVADAAGEDGALGAVAGVDEEEAASIEAGGGAGVAALLGNANPLAAHPGGGGGEALKEVGLPGFEPGEFEVECAQQSDEQGVATLLLAGGDAERGCEGRELRREAGVVDVEADTDDGVAQGGVGAGLDGGFDEDAAELLAEIQRASRRCSEGLARTLR